MSSRVDAGRVEVTPDELRSWPLPDPGDSKYSRGRVVVVGGSLTAPGAVALAGVSALRVGAGRLTLIVPPTVAVPLALVVPEAGVFEFGDDGALSSDARGELKNADAVLVGPGLADPGVTRRVLTEVQEAMPPDSPLILDAFALGVLPGLDDETATWANPLILTPNRDEAAILLGEDSARDETDLDRIADRYGAAVSCYGVVSRPGARGWRIPSDTPGLATSGSGDVLAGAVLGLAGRADDTTQAAVWATFLHIAAGADLAAEVGSIGFLARQISERLPGVLTAIHDGRSHGEGDRR